MTDTEPILLLSALKSLTVLLGLAIVALAAKAFFASRRRPAFWLAVGMAVLTLGAISEGLAFQGLGWSLAASHVFEAFVTLAGFAVLVYSLYVR
jgi:hypothetical protein